MSFVSLTALLNHHFKNIFQT